TDIRILKGTRLTGKVAHRRSGALMEGVRSPDGIYIGGSDRLWVMEPVVGRVPSRYPAARHRGPSGRCIGGEALQHDPYRIRRQDPEESSINKQKSCTGEQDSYWKQQESCKVARNAIGGQERCHELTGFGQTWQQEYCLARGVVYTGQTCDRH
ncbi:hypothetical protein ACLOJK_029230, partial [Asimina triloba]